ncbi:RGCVC family protein [Jatrophihabitans sp.]|uniref:RGCVC family protein n=1 Tax=Jatrophihabitans sp. TaxID=1932789 RepID=UPI0038CD2ADE
MTRDRLAVGEYGQATTVPIPAACRTAVVRGNLTRPPGLRGPMKQVAPTAGEGQAEPGLLCVPCGHRVQAHDPTATRYCAASRASGVDRGCLCPPGAVSAGVQPLSTTQPFR